MIVICVTKIQQIIYLFMVKFVSTLTGGLTVLSTQYMVTSLLLCTFLAKITFYGTSTYSSTVFLIRFLKSTDWDRDCDGTSSSFSTHLEQSCFFRCLSSRNHSSQLIQLRWFFRCELQLTMQLTNRRT